MKLMASDLKAKLAALPPLNVPKTRGRFQRQNANTLILDASISESNHH